ncbi:hypothetical protein [Acidovorax sp.]|uniref:hypothetical protein n=1 Tax=Acidovorax sp. TaxID=1872122 RepID=UPI00391F7E3B
MTAIKAILFGDSGAYGAMSDPLDPSVTRLATPPATTLNDNQDVFDFCYDYSRGGASWEAFFSSDPARREAAGLPGGVTFANLLTTTDAGAILFCLGGIDHSNLPIIANSVKQAATMCQAAGKHFAFVGVAEINASASHTWDNLGEPDFYASENLRTVAKIASANEMLKQTCLHEGYPMIDVRSLVPVTDWGNVTGDIIHPTQAYSTAVFTRVAHGIAGTA